MASNAWVLFENMLPDASSVTDTQGAVDGWPLTNAYDWRPGTAYRYFVSGSSANNIDYDFGVGVTKEPDTIIAGPYETDGSRILQKIQYSDNGSAWSNAVGPNPNNWSLFGPHFAESASWTGASDHRYWRVAIMTGANRYIGNLTLGRKLEIGIGGLPASLEPYPQTTQVARLMSHSGYPISANVESVQRTFTLEFPGAGLTVSSFFDPASGLTYDGDFRNHAVRDGKPFWFCWNPGTDYPVLEYQNTIFLCRLLSESNPIAWTTARRTLAVTFTAYNRAA